MLSTVDKTINYIKFLILRNSCVAGRWAHKLVKQVMKCSISCSKKICGSIEQRAVLMYKTLMRGFYG